jgi:hypothetical protein
MILIPVANFHSLALRNLLKRGSISDLIETISYAATDLADNRALRKLRVNLRFIDIVADKRNWIQ